MCVMCNNIKCNESINENILMYVMIIIWYY